MNRNSEGPLAQSLGLGQLSSVPAENVLGRSIRPGLDSVAGVCGTVLDNSSPLPPGHKTGLHFLDSLVVRCG